MDLDGVTVAFDEGWRRAWDIWFGRPNYETPPTRKWNDIFLNANMTEPEFFAWLQEVPGFWESLDPLPGALGSMRRLRAAGHEVVFVTQRPAWAKKQTENWLKRHGQDKSELIMVDVSKTDVDINLWLDDAPHHLSALKDAGKPYVFRWVQLWNNGAPGTACRSWLEFERNVEICSKIEKDPAA